MKRQTRKSRRGANLAAINARRQERIAAQAIRREQRSAGADVLLYAIRSYVGTGASLADVQAGAERGEPGAALTLSAFERLAQRLTAQHRAIVAAMREDNSGRTSARLAWPETRDRTPDVWARRIIAPSSGVARLAWREILVREGAAAAADYAARKGAAWEYPTTAADRTPTSTPTVVLATSAADREALAQGIA
jgi:hypothetical protein